MQIFYEALTNRSMSIHSAFIITISFFLLYNFPAQAESSKVEIKEYGLITPPACITDTGQRIQFYPGTSEQIVEFGGFLAAAGDFEVGKNGGIVNEDRIYYDESNMPFLHPLFQEWLFHHECAHVQLDHLEIPVQQRLGQYWTIEQGADCAAFDELKKDSDAFKEDAAFILENFRFIANSIMPAPAGKEDAKKQFVDQRIANMMACPVFNN